MSCSCDVDVDVALCQILNKKKKKKSSIPTIQLIQQSDNIVFVNQDEILIHSNDGVIVLYQLSSSTVSD